MLDDCEASQSSTPGLNDSEAFSVPMQYAITPHVSKVVCDLVGKLRCRLLQRVASSYVLEPQRIFDVHEEGGLNGGMMGA